MRRVFCDVCKKEVVSNSRELTVYLPQLVTLQIEINGDADICHECLAELFIVLAKPLREGETTFIIRGDLKDLVRRCNDGMVSD